MNVDMVNMYKVCEWGGLRFAGFISFFINNPWKWDNLVSPQDQIISFS